MKKGQKKAPKKEPKVGFFLVTYDGDRRIVTPWEELSEEERRERWQAATDRAMAAIGYVKCSL